MVGRSTPNSMRTAPSPTAHSLGSSSRHNTGHTPRARNTPPTVSPKLLSCLICEVMSGVPPTELVQLVFPPPIGVSLQQALLRLIKHEVFQHQHIHFGAHETAIGIFRCADDRFAPHIERGID